jgi:hypothetical protein
MERGQYLITGTGRIRPLAISKQATDLGVGSVYAFKGI